MIESQKSLHDHVIQRLFAVGLTLQGTVPRASSPEVQQRLSGCVDNLQEVIQEIRTAIWDLRVPLELDEVRERLDDAIAQFASLELRTTVRSSDHCRLLTRYWPIMRKLLYEKRSATLFAMLTPPH